ncbi:50S ribosomal protein L22 [Ruficoccus amylovorans]|uniref:Large ribosomal subunit protein uL22 n=1 Tax=Ruficoccus amylovorans TaxID=1804625 RepID=A0A842HB68_9BACT|nr:50S ribosomal protein L22 [Ruficoccus amylovorans]MBC2593318.1 50S ribosomal protein L22 [Ruficoccus amylovorans]
MEVQALTKYTRMSPKKVREVARQVQGRPAAEALDLLRFIPRKSARLIAKTLTSAIANAENNNNLSSDDLIVKRCLVEEGPAFKRFRPVGRGSAHPIRKRTSHIRIVLTDEVASPAANSKEQ